MVNDTKQIDLKMLENLVDESLSKETEESLNNFLNTFKMNTDALKPFDPEAFMIAHRDYKEPVKQLELFTITD